MEVHSGGLLNVVINKVSPFVQIICLHTSIIFAAQKIACFPECRVMDLELDLWIWSATCLDINFSLISGITTTELCQLSQFIVHIRKNMKEIEIYIYSWECRSVLAEEPDFTVKLVRKRYMLNTMPLCFCKNKNSQ